jgi:hypothetical protein
MRNSPVWSCCKVIKLSINMRVKIKNAVESKKEEEFVEFLLSVGENIIKLQ